MKIKALLLFAALVFSTACTMIQVKSTDAISRDNLSTLTLVDNQRIRTSGFGLKDDQVFIREHNKDLIIPRSDIHQITTVERTLFAANSAAVGMATGAVWAVYDIATGMSVDAAWGFMLYPLGIIAIGLYAGITGFAIGDRTYYEFNPLDLDRKTEYSARLLVQKETEDDASREWGGYHFALNLGGGVARFPLLKTSLSTPTQNTQVEAFFARAELGKWVDPKTIWGGNVAVANTFDSNQSYTVNRGIFSIGPQITYFPRRYGLNFKGSINYSIYYEDVENLSFIDSDGIGEIIYQKDFNGVGVFASIAYGFPLSTHINISVEFMGQGYYFSGNDPVVAGGILLGAHWY